MNVNAALDYEIVIGLEVHLQMNTESKMFCSCPNRFGEAPNSLVCPVCLGLPGSLPVANSKALDFGIKIGLALNCDINRYVKFDRKNYYYPDLPKGYQISQFDFPIAKDGYLDIDQNDDQKTTKKIRIKRAHLEEDAGKLIHDPKHDCTLVDYNRTGTPLMEIVTEPDLRSPDEAYQYLLQLKLILQYLDVSDCDMEKGSLRCDANISVRPRGQKELGVKSELKNLNSFKAVKSSLAFEAERQIHLLNAGEEVTQETRLWDEQRGVTLAMRTKEAAHDYRYFPEPDMVPFIMDESKVEKIRADLPELPEQKRERLIDKYKISDYDASILVQDRELVLLFEAVAEADLPVKKICNWIIGPLTQELNVRKLALSATQLKPKDLITIISHVEAATMSNLGGKDALRMIIDSGKSAEVVIKDNGLLQISNDGELSELVDQVIGANPDTVAQIRDGKDNAIGFLIGQAMKQSKGKGNPKKIGELIRRRLHNG